MKTIKALVRVAQDESSTSYEYPQAWLDNAASIPLVIYPKDRSGQVEQDGKTYQLVYLVASDELGARLVSECGYEEVAKDEGIAYGEANSPRLPVVADPTMVTLILAKAALGGELTQEERDALDPSKPGSGIVNQPTWGDTFSSLGL